MPIYRYDFLVGGHGRCLLFGPVSNAAYSVVRDRHDRDAEPIAVYKDGVLLWDRALIERIYAACQDDLTARPLPIPTAIMRLGERETANVATDPP
jgi:hypothetical protein